MINEMVLERKSNLVMPSHYVELDNDEMSYVDGGVSLSTWLKWIGIGIAIGAAAALVVATGGAAVGAIATLIGHLGSIATLFKAGVIAFQAFQVAKVALGIAVSLGTIGAGVVAAAGLGT